MKKISSLALIMSIALMTVACTKKENNAENAAVETQKISAEQQAAIDSVDQPNPEAIAIDDNIVAEANAENMAAGIENAEPTAE